jgi:hypothetical protein
VSLVRLLPVSLILALGFAGCAAEGEPIDELAGESALDGEATGKADSPAGTFTYFVAEPDLRRCAWPTCGGVWVERANRELSRCANGQWSARCYVAEIDFEPSGLTERQANEVHANMGATRARVLLRGAVVSAHFGELGNLGRFEATEAWLGAGAGDADGLLTKVTDSGAACAAWPCAWMHEGKLNSVLGADLAELYLGFDGADAHHVDVAVEQLGRPEGLLVAGYRYFFSAAGTWYAGRLVTQLYTRVIPAAADTCYRGGCSGQVCSDDPDVITTCEWRDEYACYQAATCERQPNGRCGFTPTPELDACLGAP